MSDADLETLITRHTEDNERQHIARLQAMADQRSDDPHFDAMAAAVVTQKVRELLAT